MKNLLNKNDKFFVAGHKGMVGQAIIRSLKEKGYCDKNFDGKLLKINKEELDLTDYKKVDYWFRNNKPSIVIIAAAKVGGIIANSYYPFDFISQNIKIAQNLIEASWNNQVKRLLFLGSSCIYPKNSNIPIKEEELLSSYLEKTNESYAIAKIAGIKMCAALKNQYGFDAICLMPTNLYGKGDNYHNQNSHVLPALINKFYNAKIQGSKKSCLLGIRYSKKRISLRR